MKYIILMTVLLSQSLFALESYTCKFDSDALEFLDESFVRETEVKVDLRLDESIDVEFINNGNYLFGAKDCGITLTGIFSIYECGVDTYINVLPADYGTDHDLEVIFRQESVVPVPIGLECTLN